jgi:mono/diheme cytochrome c family protein
MSTFRSLWSKFLVAAAVPLVFVPAQVTQAQQFLSPDNDIGARHIWMYNTFNVTSGSECLGCHTDDSNQPGFGAPPSTPPNLADMRNIDMGGDRPCASCHGDRIFLARMDGDGFDRCSDCHQVGGDRDGRGGWGGDGWGGGGRSGGWGGR